MTQGSLEHRDVVHVVDDEVLAANRREQLELFHRFALIEGPTKLRGLMADKDKEGLSEER